MKTTLNKQESVKSIKFILYVLTLLPGLSSNAQISLQMTPSNYNGYHISCFGEKNGTLDLTISGGIAPYTIVWSTGDSTEDLTGLRAGYYRVRVEDSDSIPNLAEAEITLNEPGQLRLNCMVHAYSNGYNISLYGACNGMITPAVTGGVSPYSFSWNDLSTSQNRTALCASGYEVLVADANSCTVTKEMMLKQPDRSDWQMEGNPGTDPNVNFIGTTDNTDLVFKTNGTEVARINASGEFLINRLNTNRIVSPDSIVYMGDNTLLFFPNSHSIYGNPNNTTPPNNNTTIPHKGTGLGYRTSPQGIYSTSIGHDVITREENCFAFGYKLRTDIGTTNAMVIGTGVLSEPYNSGNLVNDISNSLMIGYNSRYPTIYVSPNTSSNQYGTGTVGICTTYVHPGYKLAVNGKIIAEEVLIKNGAAWPDYVFKPGYELMNLSDLKNFINTYRHLPEIPSADTIEKNGVETSEMIRILIQKVEELTLHTIRQQDEIDRLNTIISNR